MLRHICSSDGESATTNSSFLLLSILPSDNVLEFPVRYLFLDSADSSVFVGYKIHGDE